MSTKHTPGPWKAEWSDNPGEFANIYGPRDRPVCSMLLASCDADAEMISPEDRANRRLVKAAPDLLSALEALLLTHCYQVANADLDPAVTNARALLAKIKG